MNKEAVSKVVNTTYEAASLVKGYKRILAVANRLWATHTKYSMPLGWAAEYSFCVIPVGDDIYWTVR